VGKINVEHGTTVVLGNGSDEARPKLQAVLGNVVVLGRVEVVTADLFETEETEELDAKTS